MIRSKVIELLKVSSLFFRATDTTHWALVDKAKAVSHLAEVKEGVSKHSETVSLSMETATVNGQPGSQLKGTSDSNNSQKQTSRKRKYKRSLEKYQSVVQNLDSLCDEYKKVLKNPFASMPEKPADFNTQESHLEELVKCLGSTEKIMGILQCYNYFSPIIQTGLKRMNDREDTSQIKKNMVEMSQKMLEFVDFAKTIQDEKDKLKFERNCVTALGKRKRKSSGVLDSGDAPKTVDPPGNGFESVDGHKRSLRELHEDKIPEAGDAAANVEKRQAAAFHRHAPEENPILKILKVDSSIRVGDLKSGWLLRTFEDPKMINGAEATTIEVDETTQDATNRKRIGSFDLENQAKSSLVGISPFSKLRPQDSSQKLSWGAADSSGQKEGITKAHQGLNEITDASHDGGSQIEDSSLLKDTRHDNHRSAGQTPGLAHQGSR